MPSMLFAHLLTVFIMFIVSITLQASEDPGSVTSWSVFVFSLFLVIINWIIYLIHVAVAKSFE